MSQEKKIPRPISPERLRNIALRYLDRFATSKANLKDVLMRHVHKSNHYHQTDIEEGRGWINELLVKLEQSGFINDALYAEVKAGALHRKGTSLSHIRMKLRQKGLSDCVIEHAIEELEGHDLEYEAALNYAKRRRLGKFRISTKSDDRKDKDLSAMARAGFSYDLALKILDGENDL